ncbi:peroxisomal membrane anchor protein conserved region-domain-containing protein [Cercophora newfieldiana]|uniref:Peroxisomal membrane protein PEX14 n=1 Tax=Cercophora newfieldiana TaxID=92897 RepID=A0AA40CJC7_9PEZI|nr:peroxisomal membrane anchor protein conserved region-domain-containing protein [Cercophora newfieldiana]
MGEAEDKPQPDAPAWQKAAQAPVEAGESEPNKDAPATLEQARRFLEDPEVQKQTPARKIEFLRSKGLSESDVEELLKNVSQEPQTEPPVVDRAAVSQPEPPSQVATTQTAEKKEDRPPIITYPEFLTKPVRPPPLMTVNGFLNTLYAFGGFSTLLYGTSKFVLEPMVGSLTEARVSFHETAKDDLTKLVEKLETVVSEIPPSAKAANHTDEHHDDDAKSTYEDPTELFHRDIGVQTSLPPSPAVSDYETSPPEPASHQQARRLTELVASVKTISDGLVGQTEDLGDVKSLLDVFREELDQLSSVHAGLDYGSGFSMYGSASRNEPDDEIKKAKENIRRVKGVLLSTRSFPASTR